MTPSPELKDTHGAVGPRPAAPLSVFALVAVNLLPVAGVLAGWLSMSDVFIVYWLENVAVWLITIVKVATARGEVAPEELASIRINDRPVKTVVGPLLAVFFAFHYGIFTFVHGCFAFAMAFMADSELHPAYLLAAGASLGLSHLASLGLNWYAEGERWQVSPVRAMKQPYSRMVVLHVAIIVSFFVVIQGTDLVDPGGDALVQTIPVVILCLLKTGLDLVLHLRERAGSAGGGAAPGTAHTGVEE